MDHSIRDLSHVGDTEFGLVAVTRLDRVSASLSPSPFPAAIRRGGTGGIHDGNGNLAAQATSSDCLAIIPVPTKSLEDQS